MKLYPLITRLWTPPRSVSGPPEGDLPEGATGDLDFEGDTYFADGDWTLLAGLLGDDATGENPGVPDFDPETHMVAEGLRIGTYNSTPCFQQPIIDALNAVGGVEVVFDFTPDASPTSWSSGLFYCDDGPTMSNFIQLQMDVGYLRIDGDQTNESAGDVRAGAVSSAERQKVGIRLKNGAPLAIVIREDPVLEGLHDGVFHASANLLYPTITFAQPGGLAGDAKFTLHRMTIYPASDNETFYERVNPPPPPSTDPLQLNGEDLTLNGEVLTFN